MRDKEWFPEDLEFLFLGICIFHIPIRREVPVFPLQQLSDADLEFWSGWLNFKFDVKVKGGGGGGG